MAIARNFVAALTIVVLAGCGGAVRQIPMKRRRRQRDAGGAPEGHGLRGRQPGAGRRDRADGRRHEHRRRRALGGRRRRDRRASRRACSRSRRTCAICRPREKRDEESLRRLEAEQKRVGDDVRQAGARAWTKLDAAAGEDRGFGRSASPKARRGSRRPPRETLDTAKKTWTRTRMIIEAFEKVSRRQAPARSRSFSPRARRDRARGGCRSAVLVEFADWLGRESRGRRIMFVAIGSASATGPQELNAKLAKQRSEALLGVSTSRTCRTST